ncbi:mechanosensitive ion channel family protein [Candidatus Woesearchaeota archaeon]|nr:mechanosensitive ion channel family protein [Candidatus Woesearchaeota archaeon]
MFFADLIETYTHNELLTSAILIILTIAAARILYFILEKYVAMLTKATKTTLDDELLEALKKPVYLLALVVGVYFSLLHITALSKYEDLINKLLLVMLVILGAYAISRAILTTLNWYAVNLATKTKTRVDEHFIPVLKKIISVFIYILALVVILDQLGVKVTALVASLGVASLAVALALQETLSNFFAGLYILADKPAKPGDFIRLENGTEGFVEEIGWRSTKIRLGTDSIVMIPNAKLAQNILTNYQLPTTENSFTIDCGVAYNSDLEKVEKATIRVARQVLKGTEGGVAKFEPSVRYKRFGDSNIEFSVVLRVNEYNSKFLVSHEFIKALTKEYKKEGIEISWPVRNIYMHNPHK